MTDSTTEPAVRLAADQLQQLAADVAKQLAGWLVNQVPGQIALDDPQFTAGLQVSPPTGEAVTVDPQTTGQSPATTAEVPQ